MSDNEIEGEKKARVRPQSVIAQNFSLALDNAFGLDGTFELSQTVDNKKMVVNTQSKELEALEARIRATEERLKAKTGGKTATTPSSGGPAQPSAPGNRGTAAQQARPLGGVAGAPNPRQSTVNRQAISTNASSQPARRPVAAQDDSDEEEDSEDTEDSETEESSEEEIRKK